MHWDRGIGYRRPRRSRGLRPAAEDWPPAAARRRVRRAPGRRARARNARSDPARALGSDRIARMPGRRGADAVALDMDVEQIGPALDVGALRAIERAFDLRGFLHNLALDAERLRCLGEIDIGVAVVAGHVASLLELRSAAVGPYAVSLVVVAAVVVDDGRDRRAVARHAPQRLRAPEHHGAVAEDRDYRPVRPRELGAEG